MRHCWRVWIKSSKNTLQLVSSMSERRKIRKQSAKSCANSILAQNRSIIHRCRSLRNCMRTLWSVLVWTEQLNCSQRRATSRSITTNSVIRAATATFTCRRVMAPYLTVKQKTTRNLPKQNIIRLFCFQELYIMMIWFICFIFRNYSPNSNRAILNRKLWKNWRHYGRISLKPGEFN